MCFKSHAISVKNDITGKLILTLIFSCSLIVIEVFAAAL